jgi:hypothetical protein
MKKLILALAMVLVMVAMLAAPAFAAPPVPGSHTWYLQNATMVVYANNMNFMQKTQTLSGTVNLASNSSLVWITDDYAHSKITFPNDYWVLRLMTDSDWGTNGNMCDVQLGYYDNVSPFFHTIGPLAASMYASKGILEARPINTPGDVVPSQAYLAIKVTNNDRISHDIYCGWDSKTKAGVYYSCLTTPQSDPGFPVPEVAAGLLLGAGLAAVGGFVLIRRKQSNVRAM